MNTITLGKFVFLITIISTTIQAQSLDTTLVSDASQSSADSVQETITSLSKKVEGLVRLVYSGFFVLASGIIVAAAWQNTDTLPIGLIYIQLPNQEPPKKIWPEYKWKDISSEYANLFFRVVGNKAPAWGMIQEGSAPRLVGVKAENACCSKFEIFLPDGWSDTIYSGDEVKESSRKGFRYIRFKSSLNVEVKPRNMAMRIWKHIA